MKKMPRFYKGLTAAAVLAVSMSLTACGGGNAKDNSVEVQSVSMLMGMDVSGANRYTGVAEARSTIKIEKDSDKTIAECYVEVGQEVKKGDKLFSYDQEALMISIEASSLEIEQMENQIENYATQITELEKEKNNASSSEKLSYTLQIQEIQLDKTEAEYNLKLKKKDFEKLKSSVGATVVKATKAGVVQAINDGSSSSGDDDYYGESDDSSAYMTIMETGTYRVKGIVNETNLYQLYEDMPVTVVSRTDPTMMWSGSISLIDMENPVKNTSNNYYDDSSQGESASKYNFYVSMESADGMMMGQHLYIIPGVDLAQSDALQLSSAFIIQEDDRAYVWASSKKDTLEQKDVTLGEYIEETDSYVILDGLTLEDFIAVPNNSLKKGVSVVKVDGETYGFSDGDDEEVLDGEENQAEGLEIGGEMQEGGSDDALSDDEYSEEEFDEEDLDVVEDKEE